MKRHELDVLSFMGGLLFTTLGILFALHALDVVTIDLRVAPAVALIVTGFGGIAAALRASTRTDDRETAGLAGSDSAAAEPGASA
jgi:hypothetical protein